MNHRSLIYLMQWPMKVFLKGKLTIIAIAVSIGILCLSLLKINVYEPMDLQHIDKLHHSLAYFTLVTCWLFALQKKQSKYVIVLCCIFFGIVLEILQYAITNYRTGDYLDVLANSFGVILGVFVFNKVSKKNRLKNEKTSN